MSIPESLVFEQRSMADDLQNRPSFSGEILEMKLLCSRAAICVCLAALAATACSDPEVAKHKYLANGNRLLAEQKVQRAILEYRNALRQDPRFGEARRKLAEAYLLASNPDAALREMLRAADLLGNDPAVQLSAARLLLVAGRFEDARTRAEAALKLQPDNIDALITRANAMAELKDVEGAISEIEDAIRTQRENGALQATLGVLQSRQGRRAEAEAAFKNAVRISPESPAVHVALANFYWAVGEVAQCEQALKQALNAQADHAVANRLLANLYLMTDRAPEAEQPLKMAIRDSDPTSRLALADYYLVMQRLSDAVPLLKELAARPATYAAATIRLAEIEYVSGRHSEAQRVVDELLGKQPRNALALASKSRWALAARNVDAALAAAQQAVKSDPSSVAGHFALGRAQVARGDRAGAIKSLAEVLRLNPRIVAAQVTLSELYLQMGDVPAAAAAAQQAHVVQPNNPDVQITLARSYLMQQEGPSAEPHVQAVVARHPQNPGSHSIHGLLLLAKKDYEGARAAYNRSLALEPNWIEALEGLLALDARSNKIASAISRIEQRLAKTPDDPALLLVAARTYTTAGQPRKAEDTLRRIVDIDPDNFTAYTLLGQAYVSEKRLDDAFALFDAAARRHPDRVGAATMAALILQFQNRSADARRRFEAIVAGNARAPVAANNLAWMYAEDGGNLDIALQLAQNAKSQLPDVAEVNDTLGWIYYKKDLPALAIPPLEQCVLKEPTNAIYHFHLGLAYAKAGHADKARGSLSRALKISANFQGADQARQALAGLGPDVSER